MELHWHTPLHKELLEYKIMFLIINYCDFAVLLPALIPRLCTANSTINSQAKSFHIFRYYKITFKSKGWGGYFSGEYILLLLSP